MNPLSSQQKQTKEKTEAVIKSTAKQLISALALTDTDNRK
jgi:hypothetical protein